MSDINIVPYVDVLLVLLSIFMLVATVIRHGVDVQLPQAAAQQLPTTAVPIVVSIDSFGNYYLSTFRDPTEAVDESYVIREIGGRLAKEPLRPILIRADTKVSYGTVLRMMVMLRQAGARDLGLVARPPDRP